MIKLLKIEGDTPDRRTYILFADTRAEVPATGAMTLASPHLKAGSVIFTAIGEVGILQSDDIWNWESTDESGGTSAIPDYSEVEPGSILGVDDQQKLSWISYPIPEHGEFDNGKVLVAGSTPSQLIWQEINGVPKPQIYDVGRVLTVNHEGNIAFFRWQPLPKELPTVSASDNGKVLGVVDGEWALMSLSDSSSK